ncbi:MAG: transglutaminase domain-containing protein [Candidatus Altiarchaeota archaeon]|nr:transglutaminase domain-containing protein [Candidatus Altiarchaeota archaeon]
MSHNYYNYNISRTSMDESQKYLEEGVYTRLGPRVQTLASVVLNSEDQLKELEHLIKSIPHNDYNKLEVFRKRTSDEILKDNYTTGCSDVAILFTSITRAMGIPAKFVETFRDDWLSNPKEGIQGHVYVDVFRNGIWQTYDPLHGRAVSDDNGYIKNHNRERRYVRVASGVDQAQLYDEKSGEEFQIINYGDMRDFALNRLNSSV